MHVNEDYSDTTAAAADNVLHAQMWTFINRYSSVGFIRPLTPSNKQLHYTNFKNNKENISTNSILIK